MRCQGQSCLQTDCSRISIAVLTGQGCWRPHQLDNWCRLQRFSLPAQQPYPSSEPSCLTTDCCWSRQPKLQQTATAPATPVPYTAAGRLLPPRGSYRAADAGQCGELTISSDCSSSPFMATIPAATAAPPPARSCCCTLTCMLMCTCSAADAHCPLGSMLPVLTGMGATQFRPLSPLSPFMPLTGICTVVYIGCWCWCWSWGR